MNSARLLQNLTQQEVDAIAQANEKRGLTNALIILTMLADSEINYQIQYFFDMDYTVKLGDPVNGFKETSPICANFVEVAEWLVEAVARHYPDSEFVKFWEARAWSL